MELSRREQSLLLYLETRAVDHAEVVDRPGSFEDIERLKRSNTRPTRWIKLSEEAWQDAHKARRERAERLWSKRSWKKVGEE